MFNIKATRIEGKPWMEFMEYIKIKLDNHYIHYWEFAVQIFFLNVLIKYNCIIATVSQNTTEFKFNKLHTANWSEVLLVALKRETC